MLIPLDSAFHSKTWVHLAPALSRDEELLSQIEAREAHLAISASGLWCDEEEPTALTGEIPAENVRARELWYTFYSPSGERDSVKTQATMGEKIRVLLADDHTVLREATAELVDHQPDMEVVGQAGTGEETIALARALQPDVVVMDIAMPRGNGLKATRRIVAECPGTRVLVLTAHEDAEYVISLLEAGALGYLPKTVGLNELLEAIRATSRGESVLPSSVASVVVQYLASPKKQPAEEELTAREMEVLCLLAQGLTNQEIARRLNLSVRTVEAHLTHIYTKLNVTSRTEAALLAQRRGWIG